MSEVLKASLLNYPNEQWTRVKIRNGDALNWFLATLGSTALKHELTIDGVSSELADAKIRLIELEKSTATTSEERNIRSTEHDALKSQIAKLTEYYRIVSDEVGGREVLRAEDMGRLKFRIGEIGGRYVMENSSESALPLRWPTIIATYPIYDKHRSAIAQGRDLALLELKSGNGISAKTQTQLMNSIDSLKKELRSDFKLFCKRMEANPIKNHQYAHALNFVDGLQSSLYFFLQAEEIEDVAVSKRFSGNRIEQLLAYMTRNGYQFARADPLAEAAHRRIYNEMVQYYISLKALEYASEDAAMEERAWDQKIKSAYSQLELRSSDYQKQMAELYAPSPFERIFKAGVEGLDTEGFGKGLVKGLLER